MMLLKKNIITLLGIVLGALAGYAYWYFIGCDSGSCGITSVWYISMIYGSAMGGLLGSMFTQPTPAKKK